MRDLLHDFRHAARQLAKSPGFTLAVVLCLSLGIGASAALYSFAKGILMSRPGITAPERLVRLHSNWKDGIPWGSFSYPDYLDVRDRSDVLTGLATVTPQPMNIAFDERPERVWGAVASGNYFELLGVRMALGRGFRPEEDHLPDGEAVAVLSHQLWRQRFAGDPAIVGKVLRINGRGFTVVGVTDATFKGSETGIAPRLWVPVTTLGTIQPGSRLLDARDSHWLNYTLGRLKPGISVAAARASLAATMAQLEREHPDSNTGKGITVLAESEGTLHLSVRPAFVAFLSAMGVVVFFVLLLACASVANLILARATGKRREIAVRLALGAARGRLVRELLAESLLLSLLAGLAGVALAAWIKNLLLAFNPFRDFPVDFGSSIDSGVTLFGLGVAVATSIAFGLLPALQSSKPDLQTVLKDGSRGGERQASRSRRLLVAAQVALSTVLLVSSSLALASLRNAQHIELGFEPEGQVIAAMDPGLQGYDETKGRAFFDTLLERVRALPDVAAAGYAQGIPLVVDNRQTGAIPQGFVVPPGQSPPSIDFNRVGEGYFTAMGVPLLRGRGYTLEDAQAGAKVLVVNQAFAERFWPGQDPIGKRVSTMGDDYEVIGVTSTGKYFSLGEAPKPYMYPSLDRLYRSTRYLHVRTTGDAAGLLERIRQEVRTLDAELPLYDVGPMSDFLGVAMLPSRLAAAVVSAFAVLALLLAVVGLYGVLALWVSQRRREIGVRMALGAETQSVQRLVLGHGLRLTGGGLAVGLAIGVALTFLARKVLYGISPADPRTYLAVLVVLGAATLAACLIPARRAARLEPTQALRGE